MAGRNQIEVSNGVRDFVLHSAGEMAFGQAAELPNDCFPTGRPGSKALIIPLLSGNCPAIFKPQPQAAAQFLRKTSAELFRRPHANPLQQFLDVGSVDPPRQELSRHDASIEKRGGNQVRQAMVRLLLGLYDSLVAFFSTPNNVEGDIEDFDIDLLDFTPAQAVLAFQFEGALDRRLRMDLRIELLDDGLRDTLQVFPAPIDFKRARNRFDEALVTFENLQWTRDAVLREKSGMGTAECRIRVG